jgi:hypothetical protein
MAPAGPIFKHPPKPNPNERVPELLVQVKTDRDEHKRSLAAQELRQYDPVAFPEIIGVLVDVLFNDAKPNVRGEAAQSLGKLRPVSQQVGMALEQAQAKDTSMWVRLQARTALLQYHWAGYHSKKEEGPSLQSNEPPMAGPAAKGLAPTPMPPPRPLVVPVSPAPLTPLPVSGTSAFRPMPIQNQGPDLSPPPN